MYGDKFGDKFGDYKMQRTTVQACSENTEIMLCFTAAICNCANYTTHYENFGDLQHYSIVTKSPSKRTIAEQDKNRNQS